jgi:hypothetical protein
MDNNTSAPALFDHCVEVYKELCRRAEEQGQSEEDYPTWEGFTTKVFKDLRLSVPYYTAVMNALKKMDCVRQLKRGGGGAPSRWLLLQEPTRELFETAVPIKTLAPTGAGRREAQTVQMLKDINERLTAVEDLVLPERSA